MIVDIRSHFSIQQVTCKVCYISRNLIVQTVDLKVGRLKDQLSAVSISQLRTSHIAIDTSGQRIYT
jgi:catabolite regulation protein CreA